MTIKEYFVKRKNVNNDKFEVDIKDTSFSFPCCICKHRHGTDANEPCCRCGHNANYTDT